MPVQIEDVSQTDTSPVVEKDNYVKMTTAVTDTLGGGGGEGAFTKRGGGNVKRETTRKKGDRQTERG